MPSPSIVPRGTAPAPADWERWAKSWLMLFPKIREGAGRVPRSFCMTCHRTLAGYGLITSHKMLGHDVDVPAAKQSTKEGVTR